MNPAHNPDATVARGTVTFSWELPLALMAALMAPLALWPVEHTVGIPVLIEEVYKLGLVVMVYRGAGKWRWQWLWLTGLGFAVSETLFYLFSAASAMDWGVWGLRWLTTVPLHLVTFAILMKGYERKAWWAGIAATIVLHGAFNTLVGPVTALP